MKPLRTCETGGKCRKITSASADRQAGESPWTNLFRLWYDREIYLHKTPVMRASSPAFRRKHTAFLPGRKIPPTQGDPWKTPMTQTFPPPVWTKPIDFSSPVCSGNGQGVFRMGSYTAQGTLATLSGEEQNDGVFSMGDGSSLAGGNGDDLLKVVRDVLHRADISEGLGMNAARTARL